MDRSRRQWLGRAMGAGVATGLATAARVVPAQAAFPNRPLKLIIPYPPGGSTDIVARAFGEELGRRLGQPVVVENRGGASTNLGTEAAARSPADGYTLYFGTSGLASNPHFGPIPTVDAFKELAPVGQVCSMSFLIAAHPSLPASDGASLVALARSRPGKVSIGSGSLEVQFRMLTRRASIELMHVPYKGGGQAAADAMGGHVDTVVALVPALLAHVQSGKLKAIGIAAPRRSAALPSVPTFMETGVPMHINSSWFGIFVPAGTPQPAIDRLSVAVRSAVTTPELGARLTAQGIDMVPSTPAELGELLRRDYAEYGQLARELK